MTLKGVYIFINVYIYLRFILSYKIDNSEFLRMKKLNFKISRVHCFICNPICDVSICIIICNQNMHYNENSMHFMQIVKHGHIDLNSLIYLSL